MERATWLCTLVAVLLAASQPATAQMDSFESYPVGEVDSVRRGPLGAWSSPGHVEVSRRRASTGRQALRLFGGDARQVTLTLIEPRSSGFVRFAAERWTRRQPFLFSLEARHAGAWRTIFEDDGSRITIGGYHARVACEVRAPFDALRFTCTSPDGGGILIDDLALEPLVPMRVVSITTEQPVLPVLAGTAVNPVARLRVVTEGSLDPIAVTSVRWSLASGRDLAEVAHVSAWVGRSESLDWRAPQACFSEHAPLGGPVASAAEVETRGRVALEPGETFIWLSAAVTEAVDLDGWIDAGCLELTLSDGRTITPAVTEPPGVQRFGVAVRSPGDDGVAAFRIPGIVTTNQGTLIAAYDLRHGGWGDLPGDIDVGISRSVDRGVTWEPMRIILDLGDGPAWRFDGVGDPAVLYDPVTDTIWVAATWSHGDRSWNGSGPGLTPEETGQLLLSRSTDDGRTWSPPINITSQVKDPEWAFVLQSPGRGIAMADGTLVFGAQYQLSPEQGRVPHATIITSSDHGATWRIGRGARSNTTENCVVELEPGMLMLNMRDNRGGSRAISVSPDLGRTWSPHPTNRAGLREPVCNAGLLRVRPGDDPSRPWLAFINPDVSAAPRRHITIKLSTDGGLTWPASQQRMLDEGQSAGYASLTMIDDETIGVLYEGSRTPMTFQRVAVRELRGAPDG